jgi:hypothetical protein
MILRLSLMSSGILTVVVDILCLLKLVYLFHFLLSSPGHQKIQPNNKEKAEKP